jgi:hypothetical protein
VSALRRRSADAELFGDVSPRPPTRFRERDGFVLELGEMGPE